VIRQAAAQVVGVELSLFEKRGDVVIVEPVLDEVAFPFGFDQAPLAKDAQLVRHRRLGRADGDREVAHARLAFLDGISVDRDELSSHAGHNT